MNTETKKERKFLQFVKNYLHYLILAFLIIVMAVIMIVASVVSNNHEEPNSPTNSLSFSMPVLNASILKGYDDNNLQYNSVLNQWEIHKGVDFMVENDAKVYASLSGTVTKVYTNRLEGTVVEIDHGDNLKTVYGSLSTNVNVEVGDVVNTGDVIGTASNSGINETEMSHLHYEVWKDGSKVDPSGYLNIDSK